MTNKEQVFFKDLGHMDYQSAWDLQEEILRQNVNLKTEARSREGLGDSVISAATNHHLLFVEHPPVYTLGKSGNIENVLITDEMRTAKGIEFFRTNRGGDITFHGPGQIVGYPILDLEKFDTDIGKYLRHIEDVVILTLSDFGITAGRSAGETGVWLDAAQPGRERKICAIGVRTSRWITMHGFALNVNTNLDYFNFIVPCGIQNKQVTSMQKELGETVDVSSVKRAIKTNFEKVFEAEIVEPA